MNPKNSAVITGATSGIGSAIAESLISRVSHLFLLGTNQKRLSELKARLTTPEISIETIVSDFTQETQINAASKKISEGPPIQYLVHTAGRWHNDERAFVNRIFWEVDSTEINDILSIGLLGAIKLTRTLLPSILRSPKGTASIVAISGTFSGGAHGWLPYYVSKKGLEQFIIGLSQELREFEVRANCISPSDTKTEALKEFFPNDCEKALSPQEVAETAAWLTSDAAQHITGQVIVLKDKKNHSRLPPNHSSS